MVTNSWGGNIALRLATRRPQVFRSLTSHEPPLLSLLENDPESAEMLEQGAGSIEAVAGKIAAGDHEGGARRETIEGAAHVPQLTTPERCVEITMRAVRQTA
ncbi:MAG: alpha/beta fold hydrolase [Solirubrobacterales bacterium]